MCGFLYHLSYPVFHPFHTVLNHLAPLPYNSVPTPHLEMQLPLQTLPRRPAAHLRDVGHPRQRVHHGRGLRQGRHCMREPGGGGDSAAGLRGEGRLGAGAAGGRAAAHTHSECGALMDTLMGHLVSMGCLDLSQWVNETDRETVSPRPWGGRIPECLPSPLMHIMPYLPRCPPSRTS